MIKNNNILLNLLFNGFFFCIKPTAWRAGFTALFAQSQIWLSIFSPSSPSMSVSLSHSHRADCVGELVGVFVWYSPYKCARTLAGIPACANGLLHAILNRHWACGRCIYPGFKLVRVCVCVSTPRVCFSIRGGGCTQSNYVIRAEPSGHLCGRPLQSAKDRLLDLFSPSLLVCV